MSQCLSVLVAFAIETGLKREEQFKLTWEQIDLGVITIPQPKSGLTRHIPISDGAKAILRSLDSFIRFPSLQTS